MRPFAHQMALDQRKVSLISEFLEESFVGCSVHNREDEDRVPQLYGRGGGWTPMPSKKEKRPGIWPGALQDSAYPRPGEETQVSSPLTHSASFKGPPIGTPRSAH